jgi:hypothetical protein
LIDAQRAVSGVAHSSTQYTQEFTMKHLVKITAVSTLALMAGFTNAADTTAQQVEIYFGTVPSVTDAAQLAAVPVPNAANRSGAKAALAAAGPAPALSSLQISNLGSSNVGWEGIAAAQTTTTYDHGGAQLRVVTDEFGYGNVPVARYNGSVLPSSTNYLTQTICWNGSAYVLPCSAGQTVVGWRKYWNLDGKQNGLFSYQNTSTNSPFNTLSDSISIL